MQFSDFRPAFEIELKDEGFPEEDFVHKIGSVSAGWSHLAPNANITHSVIVQPKTSGLFNFSTALISYKEQQDDKKVRVCFLQIKYNVLLILNLK